MIFKDKYVNEKEKGKSENVGKTVLSNDAFAIGEVIDDLIKAMERARLQR